MVKARVLATLGTFALCAVIVAIAGASAASASSVAPGSPGGMSYFDLARKDCVGTARNTTSKVWFTVADGVLSDTYWPTIDATNVNTLQYLVTDGHSFTDLQTRDMSYKVLPDPTGMSCTVLASDAAHHYRILTTYIADPARDAVLMRTTLPRPARDQLYVRLDPLAGGTGGGTLTRTRPQRPRERRRQHRRAGRCRGADRAGRLQHEHGHRRGQPQLRGPDLHGARVLERLLERERRLRRHGQRRADHARLRARPDALLARRPTGTSR